MGKKFSPDAKPRQKKKVPDGYIAVEWMPHWFVLKAVLLPHGRGLRMSMALRDVRRLDELLEKLRLVRQNMDLVPALEVPVDYGAPPSAGGVVGAVAR